MNIVIGLIIIVLVAADQLSKMWAVERLANHVSNIAGSQDILIWPNVFHLHYIPNYGAAWGMLEGKKIFLILVTGIIVIGMIYYFNKLPHTKWGSLARMALVMIISGAIGNLIDRIWLGYVRDFLYFKLINFPIFNVADILVVVGVGLLMIVFLFGKLDEVKTDEE